MATSRICSIADCGKPHKARGLCLMHKRRVEKYGSFDLPYRATVCIESGCDRKPRVRGQCLMHWKRESRGGLTRAPVGARGAFIEAALASQTDACIAWPFGRAPKDSGRGRRPNIKINGKDVPVAAYVCERVHGPRPPDKDHAAHSCGKGHLGCVNPRHLRWATALENIHDKFAHGTVLRGEQSPSSKLKDIDVLAIRADTRTGAALAAEYGVTTTVISRVRRGISWRHLLPAEPN